MTIDFMPCTRSTWARGNGRDWTRERRRKTMRPRAAPTPRLVDMARDLRELLNALAEDDRTLFRRRRRPPAAFLRGLNAREYELEP
jgi:hypothetical protein